MREVVTKNLKTFSKWEKQKMIMVANLWGLDIMYLNDQS